MLGRYEIVKKLATGGMSEVFLASFESENGPQLVVLKRIHPDARNNEVFVQMFLDEAKVTASLKHPNIAEVYEFNHRAGELYLALEYVAGKNLNEVIDACAQREKPLPLGFSVAAMIEVAEALEVAHSHVDEKGRKAPIIHRDVAQKNVMVGFNGAVKLLDFGIAKAKNALARTNVGTVKGTAGYMSPEQVRGEPLDGRSDLFSLGITLWELVTGRRLFHGASEIEEMKLILGADIPAPAAIEASVPEALSKVILKALVRDRDGRYRSCRDFAAALRKVAQPYLLDEQARAAFLKTLFPAEGEMMRHLPLARRLQPLVQETTLGLPAGAVDVPQTLLRSRGTSLTVKSFGLGVVVVAAVVGPGLGWMYSQRERDVPVVDPVEVDPNIAVFPEEYPTPGAPRVLERPAAPLAEPPSPPAQAVEDEGAGKAAPKKTGFLTLVSNPPARVFRGVNDLGTTPLFRLKLPAGRFRLKLLFGATDARELNVEIEAGKTSVFNFKSPQDLPVYSQ